MVDFLNFLDELTEIFYRVQSESYNIFKFYSHLD